MHTDLAIIGAGGHSKVIADVLNSNGIHSFTIFDSSPSKAGSVIQNVYVSLLDDTVQFDEYHISIGNNQVRNDLYKKYKLQAKFISVISKQAYIAHTAIIGEGAFIAAKSVVSADSIIGFGCIVNHGAIIEHDCEVGVFSHIAPNATLLGGVTLGERVFVGAGATILPGVKIVDDVIIGAGAVVLSDILEHCTVVGAPARKI